MFFVGGKKSEIPKIAACYPSWNSVKLSSDGHSEHFFLISKFLEHVGNTSKDARWVSKLKVKASKNFIFFRVISARRYRERSGYVSMQPLNGSGYITGTSLAGPFEALSLPKRFRYCMSRVIMGYVSSPVSFSELFMRFKYLFSQILMIPLSEKHNQAKFKRFGKMYKTWAQNHNYRKQR